MTVTVKREGHIWQQDYERGKVVSDLNKIGETDETWNKSIF